MSDELTSPSEADLHAQLQFGVLVEQWNNSPIGRYFIIRSEEERKVLLEAFTDIDPEDTKMIRAIQHKIQVIDTVKQWLAEAIVAAQVANARLDELSRED